MPIILDIEQNTPEWYSARLGIPTSSQFSRILTSKGKRSESWQKYMDELATEAVTGKPSNTFESYETRLGHEQEPEGRWWYSQVEGVDVRQVGFIFKDERRLYGCSTDGLVGDPGVYECKGGRGDTHIQALRDHERNPALFPSKHFQQIQGELFITEREWCDLHKFHPGMKSILVRVYRDEKWISILEKEIEVFCQELQETIRFARAA